MPQRSDPGRTETPGPWWKRLAWFVGLWLASVAVVAAVAYGIRLWIV